MRSNDVAEMRQIRFFHVRAEDGVRIDVCIEVKKGIHMYACRHRWRVAGGAEISGEASSGLLKKWSWSCSAARVAVSVVCAGKPVFLLTESFEARKDGFQKLGLSFARCWFSAGKGWAFPGPSPEVSISPWQKEEPLETRNEIRVSV